MGIVNNTYQFTEANETVTMTKLNNLAGPLVTEFNGNVDNDNIKAGAGIDASKLNFSVVSEYADNATAVSGGLAVGAIYRTGDILKVVHS